MLSTYLKLNSHHLGLIAALIGTVFYLIGWQINVFAMLFFCYLLGRSLFYFIDNLLLFLPNHTHKPHSVSNVLQPIAKPVSPFDFKLHQQLFTEFDQFYCKHQQQLPQNVKALMQEIYSIMSFMHNKIQQSQDQRFQFEISDIQRTMTAYLIPAVKNYVQLPNFLREKVVNQLQLTPSQLLEQQLELIINELKNIAESIYLNDLNKLIDQGLFLKQKLQ